MDCVAIGPGHEDVTRLGASGSFSCALGALAYFDHEAKLLAEDAKTLRSIMAEVNAEVSVNFVLHM